jgi:hypothetical protein
MAPANAHWLSLLGSALLCIGCTGSDSGPVARSGLSAHASARAALTLASAACGSSDHGAAATPATTSTATAASVSTAAQPIVGGQSRSTVRSAGASVGPSRPEQSGIVPLRVKRLVLARSITAREPVDVTSSFAASEIDRIYAFVEVENPERAASEIVVTFEPEHGSPTGYVRLDVGASPRWRTWAYTRAARQPGGWAAVVRDGQGTELARTAFEVRGDGAAPKAIKSQASATAVPGEGA